MKVFFFFALLLSSTQVLATKPCFYVCHQNNLSECGQVATWMAEGSISEIRHDKQPPPLNKDFASFTFTVQRWIKGEVKGLKRMRFKVGWCDNYKGLPENTDGRFLFYGASSPDAKVPTYYWFKRVK